jgi:hypothetical protein
MLAYKFRPPSQLKYALDIIRKKRLYCSDWEKLNDPMKGIFRYSYRSDERSLYDEFVRILHRKKKRLLVCSLSKTFDSHLLWAHYAEGFRGLAIEVELPDDSPSIQPIKYREVPINVCFDDNFPPTREEILSSKYVDWEYEGEVRILQPEKWYPLSTPVRRVIAGQRMGPDLFEQLRLTCQRRNIILSRTRIQNYRIYVDDPPINETTPQLCSARHSP